MMEISSDLIYSYKNYWARVCLYVSPAGDVQVHGR